MIYEVPSGFHHFEKNFETYKKKSFKVFFQGEPEKFFFGRKVFPEKYPAPKHQKASAQTLRRYAFTGAKLLVFFFLSRRSKFSKDFFFFEEKMWTIFQYYERNRDIALISIEVWHYKIKLAVFSFLWNVIMMSWIWDEKTVCWFV